MLAKIFAALILFATLVTSATIWRQSPLQFAVGERTFFLGEIGGLLLTAAAVLAILGLFYRTRGRTRWAVVAGGALLLAAALFSSVRDTQADVVQMTALENAPERGRKTLIVGVDALAWNRLLPLVNAGRLPNFKRLMERGSSGVLYSHRTFRPSVERDGYWSPVVWTSIATGVTVDKHGIDDFAMTGAKGKVRPAGTWHRKVPAFWNLLSHFGRSVGIVGWWASWPAEEVDGILVSSNVGLRGHRGIRAIELDDGSWFRKRRRLTHPEPFKHVIANDIGLPQDIDAFIEREVFPLERYPIRDGDDRETIRSVLWQDRLYQNVALHLLRNKSFDVYATYLEGIDVLSHQFWEFMAFPESFREQARFKVADGFTGHAEVVDRYYEVVDDYLGELVEAGGEEMTIIVCSDHGFETAPDRPRRADHSGFGAVIMAGPGIRAGLSLNLSLGGAVHDLAGSQPSVLDILPTLLYLHNIPISDNLDGHVLYRALERGYVRSHPEIRVNSYGDWESTREIEIEDADTEEYLDRMRSLGYVG